jgi:hypothetical protein
LLLSLSQDYEQAYLVGPLTEFSGRSKAPHLNGDSIREEVDSKWEEASVLAKYTSQVGLHDRVAPSSTLIERFAHFNRDEQELGESLSLIQPMS